MSKPKCPGCEQPVDDDGYTLAPCQWGEAPAECEECGFCYCDGSC